MKLTRKNSKEELLWAAESQNRRIRELEAELAVRDNMGNEVLRILREATGKRDFHSEMEAAEYAAELIRAGGWRPIAEAPEGKELLVGGWVDDYWDTDIIWKHTALDYKYTHYLPEPEPPAREVENGSNQSRGFRL